ncbi:MAG: hypothetical protein KKB13_21800 [Chloroflexi bacterium]|nr:hypothetical protein [Chloroflexota bacterium]
MSALHPMALVLHTDIAVRDTIVLPLSDMGVQALEGYSVQQGLGLAQQLRPDLLFAGPTLADGATADLIRQLRARDILTPVVLLVPVGPVEVLREPWTPEQVQHVAGRLLAAPPGGPR